MKHSNLYFFLNIFIVLISFCSCNKDRQYDFPGVPIFFTINLITDPEYIMLQAQGNTQKLTYLNFGLTSLGYGNNGVIVYNAGGGEFIAFDATCPYDLPEIYGVELSGTSGIVVCPKCNSRYVLPGYGMPTKDGPAIFPLQEYQTYYNPNTGNLTVSN
jgi:hypothetical protein